MPNCIIMGCPHKTGNTQKFPGIVLHSFPSSIERIKRWILQTGQIFQDPDALANKIYEGKKTDTFRMCSAHFTKDSYIFTAQKRFLRHNALPAIFPQATEGKPLIDEQKIVGKKKRKSERVEAKNINSFICNRCLMSENIYEGKVLVDAATQTENNIQPQRTPQVPVLPLTQTVFMLSVPFQSYPTQPIPPIMTTPTLGGHSVVTFNNLKNTNFLNTSSATTSQSFPHPVLERGSFPLPVSSEHNTEHIQGAESHPQSDMFVPRTEDDTLQKIVRGRKVLVFEECLDSLMYMVKCQDDCGCNKLVKRFNKEYRGSAVIIRGQCEDGHFFKIWESQPRVKRCFAGDVLMAASLFCSSLKYHEAHNFFNCLGLRQISEKTIHHYEKYFCYPAIHAAWVKEQKKVSRELHDRPVFLAGDWQYGSSGSNSVHCVYTLSDIITDKIVDFEIIQSTSCQPFVDMEKYGFEVCMSRAMAEGVDIACFASDRNERIVESMKENYGHVEHQLNVRRYAKRILRKLKTVSRSRFCAAIGPWTKHIYDHFLWSVQTSEQNELLLREKWLSVLHHIIGQHSWEEGSLYKQCEHADLSRNTDILWLKPGSPSFQKIQEIVADPQLIEDLKYLTWNCQSGISLLNNIMKSSSKRPHSGIDEMEARIKLAALNHNQNVGRRKTEVRVVRKRSDRARRKRMATNKRTRWLVRPLHETRNSDYLWPVMEGVLGICEGREPTSDISEVSSTPPNLTSPMLNPFPGSV